MNGKKKTVAVIGAGIAGLAVAIRLANSGYSVEIFETNSYAGGKITEFRNAGYRFDAGPSVLTMPSYINELFALSGEDANAYFQYKRLDPIFQYFFEDGSIITTYADVNKTIDELVEKTSVTRDNLKDFFRKSKEKLELTDPVFLQRTLHRWKNYLDRPTLTGVLNFHKIEAFTSMAEANAKLFCDPKVESIFNQYAGYNGSNPYVAPATLNLIAHYELALGAYYPQGGIHKLTQALVGLAMRSGVRINLNSKVNKILISNGKAFGINSNNKDYNFDHIVCNSDVFNTYKNLLPNQKRPSLTLDRPKSSSVIIFYWGIKKKFAQLKLHNMFMSNDQKADYEAIFEGNGMSSDPTVYLYISSKENPSDAPSGCENWFTMVAVPHNTGQDWDTIIEQTREVTLNKLSRILNTEIQPLIEQESVLDPRLIEQRTGSAFGAVYGNSSNGKFAAFLRHPNFSSRIKNLFFCGGSVHPGSSIPLCLLSAKITCGLIEEH